MNKQEAIIFNKNIILLNLELLLFTYAETHSKNLQSYLSLLTFVFWKKNIVCVANLFWQEVFFADSAPSLHILLHLFMGKEIWAASPAWVGQLRRSR